MIFNFRGESRDLDDLRYIVYVDDMNDGWLGAEYILFVFEDENFDFSKGEYWWVRYDLDSIDFKDDVVFLEENLPKIASILESDISISRSVHYPFYSEIIYPVKRRGEPFYIEKTITEFRLPWDNLHKIESFLCCVFEILTLDFLKKKKNIIYIDNPELFRESRIEREIGKK